MAYNIKEAIAYNIRVGGRLQAYNLRLTDRVCELGEMSKYIELENGEAPAEFVGGVSQRSCDLLLRKRRGSRSEVTSGGVPVRQSHSDAPYSIYS